MANLIEPEWQGLDSAELMLLLKMRIGGPGQYDGRDKNRNVFYLPLARSLCKVKLTFRGKRIIGVEPGPAFSSAEWNQIRREVETVQTRFSVVYLYDFSLRPIVFATK